MNDIGAQSLQETLPDRSAACMRHRLSPVRKPTSAGCDQTTMCSSEPARRTRSGYRLDRVASAPLIAMTISWPRGARAIAFASSMNSGRCRAAGWATGRPEGPGRYAWNISCSACPRESAPKRRFEVAFCRRHGPGDQGPSQTTAATGTGSAVMSAWGCGATGCEREGRTRASRARALRSSAGWRSRIGNTAFLDQRSGGRPACRLACDTHGKTGGLAGQRLEPSWPCRHDRPFQPPYRGGQPPGELARTSPDITVQRCDHRFLCRRCAGAALAFSSLSRCHSASRASTSARHAARSASRLANSACLWAISRSRTRNSSRRSFGFPLAQVGLFLANLYLLLPRRPFRTGGRAPSSLRIAASAFRRGFHPGERRFRAFPAFPLPQLRLRPGAPRPRSCAGFRTSSAESRFRPAWSPLPRAAVAFGYRYQPPFAGDLLATGCRPVHGRPSRAPGTSRRRCSAGSRDAVASSAFSSAT